MLAYGAERIGFAIGAVLLRVGRVKGVEGEVVVVRKSLSRKILCPRIDLHE